MINIPFYTKSKNRKLTMHYAELDRVKSETDAFNKRASAYENLVKTGEEATKAIAKIASKTSMTMNQELYSGASGYENPTTFSNHMVKKRLAKIAYSQSPAAQSLLGRFVDMVYGPSLDLQSMPIWDLIPGSKAEQDDRDKYVKNIEQRNKLWVRSNKSDYYQKRNHIKRSRINLFDLFDSGETITVLRYSQSRKRNPMSVQKIYPSNLVRIDSKAAAGNTEVDGIEYNSKSQPVAYHIADPNTSQSTRILRYQKSGRVNVIHNTIGDGHRGEPLLTGIISEITKISDFEALEVQAAVMNAMFAVWVETEIGGDEKKIGQSLGLAGNSSNDETYRSAWDTSEFKTDISKSKISRGGLVAEPGTGQKIHSFDTKRPTANFEAFTTAVKRNLFSARGMSIAVADYNFNGSYSAARGELLVFWNRVMTIRLDHILEYESIIYQMWMWGEIDNGNIDSFGNQWYSDETVQEAISFARWTGPQRPDIDPFKSAKAHEIEDKMAYKTSAKITAERGGGDWDENMQRKIIENNARAEANREETKLEKTSYSESKTESTSKNTTVEGGA